MESRDPVRPTAQELTDAADDLAKRYYTRMALKLYDRETHKIWYEYFLKTIEIEDRINGIDRNIKGR